MRNQSTRKLRVSIICWHKTKKSRLSFLLNPLVVFLDEVHEAFHGFGFGFGEVEIHRRQALALDLGLSETSTREM